MTGWLSALLVPALLAGVPAATASDGVARPSERASGVAQSAAPSCPTWQRSRAWSPAQVLSRPGRQFAWVRLAVEPSGQAVAAWGDGVTVAQRRAGGRFGRARQLASYANEGGPIVQFGGGRPLVAWADRRRLQLAIGSASGGGFRTSQVVLGRDLSFALAGGAGRPGLFVWSDGSSIVAADVVGGQLGPPQPLPVKPDFAQPALAAAVDSRGGASVASNGWSGTAGSPFLTVIERPPGGVFGAPHTVLMPEYPGPMVVRDAGGGAAAIWQRALVPVEGRRIVEGFSRTPGGAFGTPHRISSPGADAGFVLRHAADADGNAIATWVESVGRSWRVMAAQRRAGAAWGRARTVVKSGRRPHDPLVALNERGQAAVVFSVACGRRAALMSVRRRSSGAWRGPEVLAAWTGYVPASHSLGIDSRGALTELWSRRPRTGGGLSEIPIVAAERDP